MAVLSRITTTRDADIRAYSLLCHLCFILKVIFLFITRCSENMRGCKAGKLGELFLEFVVSSL